MKMRRTKNLISKVLLLLLTVFAFTATSQPFITTWKTDNPGVSANNQITIPTTGTGYNYNIYWEQVGNPAVNGTLNNQIANSTITFPSVGTYRVEISGSFPRIYFNNAGDRQKILSIEQWGNIAWSSMERAYWGCSSLTYNATDIPDLSGVTSLSFMFQNATSFNGNIGNWNVSSVTTMAFMFNGASSFNQDINNWNVSNVVDMQSMFLNATSFNQNLNGWDVGSVTNMGAMFQNAIVFNGNITAWDVSSVTLMNGMFNNASAFNQDIGTWNIVNVTNMNALFQNAASFNQNIGGWDLSGVTFMSQIFAGAINFNQDISGWNVSSVSNMGSVFQNATSFNQDLSTWNVSNATNMGGMFNNAISFNQDIAGWDVSNVTGMGGMFNGASAFNQNLSAWDVSSVINMNSMFNNASSFNQNLGSWNISSVTNMTSMLGGSGISTINYDATLIGWAAQSVQPNVTLTATGLRYCNSEMARNSLITTYNWTITGDILFCSDQAFITTWKTDNPGVSANNQITIPASGTGFNIYWEQVGNPAVNGSISNQTGSTTITFPAPGTYRVEIVGDLLQIYFNGSGDRQKILTVEQWGDTPWTTLEDAFEGCSNLTIPASDAPDLSNVTSLVGMFSFAVTFNQSIDHWNVSTITDMSRLFWGANNFNQPLNSWDVSNVTNMGSMFEFAISFNQNLDNWVVSSVTEMGGMFWNASVFNQDVSAWDVSNVTSMYGMFGHATAFNQNIGAWDVSQVVGMPDMLSNSGLSTAN